MTFLRRLLLALILVVTCFTGIVLFAHVIKFVPSPLGREAETPSPLEEDQVEALGRPGASWFLSRLSLFPKQKRQRSLVAVMVENHEDARPYHRGLEDALLIEEFLVEGLISRFIAVFDVNDLPADVGPVRSLRPYFIDGVLPWVRTFLHAGGSPEALERVEEDENITAFNGLYLPDHFLRDDTIPEPHNLFISRKHVQDLLKEEPQSTLWPPYETGENQGEIKATKIAINFFNALHDVTYNYKWMSKSYERINGGGESAAHPRNLLILEMPIENVGEYGRLSINVSGHGRALLFRNGTVQEQRWYRPDIDEALSFENDRGDPLVFSTGQTWITVLPTLERVRWGTGEDVTN